MPLSVDYNNIWFTQRIPPLLTRLKTDQQITFIPTKPAEQKKEEKKKNKRNREMN